MTTYIRLYRYNRQSQILAKSEHTAFYVNTANFPALYETYVEDTPRPQDMNNFLVDYTYDDGDCLYDLAKQNKMLRNPKPNAVIANDLNQDVF